MDQRQSTLQIVVRNPRRTYDDGLMSPSDCDSGSARRTRRLAMSSMLSDLMLLLKRLEEVNPLRVAAIRDVVTEDLHAAVHHEVSRH